MQRSLVVLGLTSALTLAGCGTTRSSDAARTGLPGAAVTGTTAPVDTAFAGTDSGRFCELIRSFNDDSSRIAPASNDPLSLRVLFRRSAASIKQAASLAPGEISGDVSSLAKVYADFLAALERVDFDLLKLPASVVGTLSAPETLRASARISAYTANICKVTG